MAKGYRYYETDFQPGYIDTPTADHLPNLSPDKQKAETAIRAGDKRGRSRAHALFVFEDLDVARGVLSETRGEQLYEMSIEDKDVLHRADLRVYDEIVNALKAERNVDGLVREFWAGIERPLPRIELAVMKATVVRKILDNT
jgi:hypothetical protein